MLLGLNKKRQACRGHFDEPTKVYGAVNTYSTPSICWIQRCLPRNGNLMRCTSQTVSSPLIYGAKKKKKKRKRAGEKSWKTAGNLLQPNTTWLCWSPLASASWSWSVLRLITLHSLIPLSCFLLASPPRPFSFLSSFFFFLEKVDLIQTEANQKALWWFCLLLFLRLPPLRLYLDGWLY